MAVCIAQIQALVDAWVFQRNMKKIDISQWPCDYLEVEDHIANVSGSSRLVFSFKMWNMFWGSVSRYT